MNASQTHVSTEVFVLNATLLVDLHTHVIVEIADGLARTVRRIMTHASCRLRKDTLVRMVARAQTAPQANATLMVVHVCAPAVGWATGATKTSMSASLTQTRASMEAHASIRQVHTPVTVIQQGFPSTQLGLIHGEATTARSISTSAHCSRARMALNIVKTPQTTRPPMRQPPTLYRSQK